MRAFLRQTWVSVRLLIVMTVLLGVAYPLTITVVGRLVPGKADGSFVNDTAGRPVGSLHIGQGFGEPQWFWPRPSVAGSGYDSLSSGGSNLGPSNPDLVSTIAERKSAVAAANGIAPNLVPADAVTASGSGLDPDISPEYALQQVRRIAAARNLSVDQVTTLVEETVQGRLFGFIGEPRVNVLELNLALDRLG